jgi:hypothetical protein
MDHHGGGIALLPTLHRVLQVWQRVGFASRTTDMPSRLQRKDSSRALTAKCNLFAQRTSSKVAHLLPQTRTDKGATVETVKYDTPLQSCFRRQFSTAQQRTAIGGSLVALFLTVVVVLSRLRTGGVSAWLAESADFMPHG